MHPITTPEKLYTTAQTLHDQNAVGFLLSGGCTPTGEMINLRKLLPTIQKIKNTTNLIIKLHTGLVDQQLAQEIVNAGVDIASLEIVGSQATIQNIFDFPATPQTYATTLQNIQDAGMKHIVPHICIGLDHGQLTSEHKALDIIKHHCTPSVLVMIIFRPTKNTPLAQIPPPQPHDVTQIITYAKQLFPTTDLSLGCMRPRTHLREEIELAALKAGATRMEIPHKHTLQHAQQLGYTIRTIQACCALPAEYENLTNYQDNLHTHSHTQQITHTR
jgi:uncharacterized radical SAM superfamily protein